MTFLLKDDVEYKRTDFRNEDELEKVVVKNYKRIFGEKTVYFDIKKKVKSKKGNINSIPDGYVISFMGPKPRLLVIENELSIHDPIKHIGIQLWNFASSFKDGNRTIKKFLLNEINNNKSIKQEINKYLKKTVFPNISELLDFVIFENDYSFVVVIDDITETLNFALKQLANKPDIIELKKYTSTIDASKIIYRYDKFQGELLVSISKKVLNVSEFDTIVCPANKQGFKDVFLGEDRWYAIRMSPSIIPQIRYVAMYETAPVSAIRWIGIIKEIKPYKDTAKYEIILIDKKQIKPIKLTPEETKKGYAPQGPRYSKMDLIKKAKKMSDIF